MSAQDIVARLDHCRETSPGEWMARCPAHDDKSPSLSVKDAGGGRTLIHCFAGCGAIEILGAVGLDTSDLYPPMDKNHQSAIKRRERSVDELVLEIAKADRAKGKKLSQRDLDREAEAFARIVLGDESPKAGDFRMNALAVAKRYSRRR